MATAGVGFATAPAAAQSDTNGTATVSDTFEAYEVGTNNPGPWTAPSGSSGSAVVGDSFLGDRALEVTDSDGAAIYDGATVDSNDARGTGGHSRHERRRVHRVWRRHARSEYGRVYEQTPTE